MERAKNMKKKMSLIIIVVLFIAGGYFFYYSQTLPAPNTNVGEVKNFTVQPGWGSQKISQELKKAGLIRDEYVFELYVWGKGLSSKLLPGNYALAKNLSIIEVAQILSRGVGSDKEVTLTFIEGWNTGDIAEYLANKGIASREDFFALIQKKAVWWDEYDFLRDKPRNLDLEGYLFPDTYRVYRDAPLADIVRKLLNNFGAKLTPDLRAEITRQGRTIHEVVTLASIVEKEVATDTDRQMVADIFYKRISAGMGLQSDATVNYVTGLNQTQPTAKELEVDNPYNTYKYRGLPPGPICNPSLAAIKAVIYPTGNPYMYFLTTPQGEVIYSRTHDEHVAAKAKYLK